MSGSFLVTVLAMLFAARLLYGAASTLRSSRFWDHDLAPEPTHGNITFDVAGGILLPLFCLIADPVVFTGTMLGAPLLGQYALLAYVTIGTAILSLTLWLVFRRPAALLAGFLAAGALLAFLLGVVLLPLSMIGLFMAGIGVLGLSPFVTAAVFWRNGRRAWAQARQGATTTSWPVALVVTCGFVVACAGPLVTYAYVEHEITRATELALSPDATEAAQGIRTLRRWNWVADPDRLVWVYAAERDAVRRERIAEAYKKLTGMEVGHRLARLRD